MKLHVATNPIYVVASVSVITGMIINLTFVPMYSAHCLNAPKTSFYGPIIKSLTSSAIMVLIFSFIAKTFTINTWMQLILASLLCAFIGGIVSMFIMFNKNELEKIFGVVKSKIVRH